MPRDGLGNYTLPAGNPVVTGSTISSTVQNNTLSDIASAIQASIASDGQTAISADIPFNSHKATGLANGTASTDATTIGQLAATSGSSLIGWAQNIVTAAARTAEAKLRESISILDIQGVVGDGALTALAGTGTGTDNIAAIQAGLNAIVAAGRPRRVIVPDGYVFRMDNTLVVNCTFITLDFQGGAFDFTNIGAKPMVQICATGTNPYSAQAFWAIGNGKLQGPAYTVAGSVGLFYQSNVGGIGNTDVAATGATGLNVWGCETSIKVGNNAYSNIHVGCKFWFSVQFLMLPASLTNAGVKWGFTDCQFLNGKNGFTSYEPTANVELMNCIVVTTDGYTFRPEAGYFTMVGGSVEVDATGGAQFIYNSGATGSKNTVTTLGANLLFKNQISKSTIELNSTNSYVTMVGGHASVADAATPGTVPMIKGTGSGAVVLKNVLPDGVLNPISSLSLGAGFTYEITEPFTGQVYSNMKALYAGLTSVVAAGGSVFALSGNESNSVTINATPTVLVADDAHHYFFVIRDATSGGMAIGMYEGANAVNVITTTLSNISLTRTTSGLKAATTGGTTTRTLKVLAMRI